jgi:chemosensory pili system protein ChpB (putative protein-glutamate methylesterase)
MKGKHNRVGVIATSPLIQHQLQVVIDGAGYDVAVNTSPERLNKQLLKNETIRLWVIELEENDENDEFVQDVLELTDAPVFFGDGVIPGKNDEEYIGWQRRIHEKLISFAPPVVEPPLAPEIDLDGLMARSETPSFELPDSLKNAPSPFLGPLWVLCASLGGPKAVKDFVDLLPKNIPACFLYAQHIDAGCLDALVQSVGRHTELNMVKAEHGMQLENGKVCVIPVDNEVVFTENSGVLWQENPWSGPYGPSLDQLLKNVTQHFGRKANAIIFSGMGSDGTIGSTLVKEAGGTVWSQTTESCIQPSMPDSADDAGSIDWRGTPSEMAEKLISWLAERKTQAA